jgi:hypothetical protein
MRRAKRQQIRSAELTKFQHAAFMMTALGGTHDS